MSNNGFSKMDVVILAGGLGLRLRPVISDVPKILAEIAGRPFITYIFDMLLGFGLKRVILCTGYLGEKVIETLGYSYKGLELIYSTEHSPLGTGGAIRNAIHLIQSDPLLVMNGDSVCKVDLAEFLKWHILKRAEISLVLVYKDDISRYGKVILDSADKIIGFIEKIHTEGPGWINGGIYLIARNLIEGIEANRSVSLETDIFPEWIKRAFYGYKYRGDFIDIGTPESYKLAFKLLPKMFNGS